MIIHEPLGIEHPYDQQAHERFPRQPVAGEPVTLGIIAAPGAEVGRVWAVWQVDDGPAITTDAIANDDHWQVALPPFAAGQRVTYQLHGSGPGGSAATESFAFDVPGWQRPNSVDRLDVGPDGFTVRFAFDDAATDPIEWRISVETGDHLLFHLGAPQSTTATIPPAAHAQLTSHGLSLDVWTEPYRLEIRDADGRLLLSQSLPEWLLLPGQSPLAVRLAFDSPPDEGFYGFGERFNTLNQRGVELDSLVYEQYKNQGRRTYIPMPWFLSSQGYGFYLQTAERVRFDLAAADPGVWKAEVPLGNATLNAHLFTGDGPREQLRAFSRLTGSSELPPDWIFGPWMSGNEWNTQAEVMRQVDLTEAHDIPASVVVIEAWSDETTFYIWNGAQYEARPGDHSPRYEDFTFRPDGPWPDPKGMIDELHRRGIKVVLWQIPILKYIEEHHAQHEADRALALERDYCLRYADGSPYQVRPIWFHDSLLLDPSNPEAQDWWLGKRAYLLDDLGVDGFKTDGGEHLWGGEVVMDNGARGQAAMNLYPNLYIGMYHRMMRERGIRPLTFSRAGYTGAQSIPCHWAGDENSTWPAYRSSLLAGLNAALSGIIFWGWDIGGFSGDIPDAELYLRSTAMATFCPIMQYHSELNNQKTHNRDRTPWNMAERTGQPEVMDIYRRFAYLRLRLMPYLQAEATYCVENAEPLMRPLFLDWPEQPETWSIDDQYMLGRSLLVAPVLEPGQTTRRVFIPPGEWLDFWTGEPLLGRRWIEVDAPLDRIPVFRRADGPWNLE